MPIILSTRNPMKRGYAGARGRGSIRIWGSRCKYLCLLLYYYIYYNIYNNINITLLYTHYLLTIKNPNDPAYPRPRDPASIKYALDNVHLFPEKVDSAFGYLGKKCYLCTRKLKNKLSNNEQGFNPNRQLY